MNDFSANLSQPRKDAEPESTVSALCQIGKGEVITEGTSHRDLSALKKLSRWSDLASTLREKGTMESRKVALYL